MNLRTEQVILTDIPGSVLEYIIPKGMINIGSTLLVSFCTTRTLSHQCPFHLRLEVLPGQVSKTSTVDAVLKGPHSQRVAQARNAWSETAAP